MKADNLQTQPIGQNLEKRAEIDYTKCSTLEFFSISKGTNNTCVIDTLLNKKASVSKY